MNELQQTAERIQQAVREHNIQEWKYRNCIYCNAPVRYVFNHDQNRPYFDPNCKCPGEAVRMQPREWIDVASLYDMRSGERRAQADEVFKFNQPV